MREDGRGAWKKILEGAGCSEGVIRHCEAVSDLAMEFHVPGITDRDILLAGAMLHDIGRSRTHDLSHAQAGAEYCREIGLGEEIARIVECHLGAGLTADECTLLRLRPVDCIPRTAEERAVANADNLVSKSRVVGIEERMMRAMSLPRKVRRRMFRLWLEMETFREFAESAGE